IWNIEDGGVEVYGGTLDEYMHSCALRREGEGINAPPPASLSQVPEVDAVKRGNRQDARQRKRREAEQRKQRNKTIGPLQNKVTTLEERISELETQQGERSALLSDPSVYDDTVRRDTLLRDYQSTAQKLEELTARWE